MDEASRQIFVVEDDPSMDVAIGRLLHAAGLQTLSFSSAEALLESEKAATAACFVLDIDLPGISGIELSIRLAQMGILRPVIFVTAYDQPEIRQRATDAGAVGYFAKPFRGLEFVRAVSISVRSFREPRDGVLY